MVHLVNFNRLLFRVVCKGQHFVYRCSTKRTISNIYTELNSRGLIKSYLPQNKNAEISNLLRESQVFYAGFDPTGPSLHIGNLLIIMNLLRSLRNGHKVICVIGDATASIGDPSGREKEREALDYEVIKSNSSRISSQISSIFSNHFKHFWKPFQRETIPEPIILNNEAWYSDKKLLSFMRDVGRHVNLRNLTRKSFVENRSRNLSFAEFSYQLIQAYDWLYLFDNYGCRFQFGGADQIHNIEAGHTLVQNLRKQDVFGLFAPLLLDKTGLKMGKTEGKSVFLDRFVNSPFNFYQILLKLPHSHMELYLKYFTFFSAGEIESIIQKSLKSQSLYAQHRLAKFLTLLVHGETGLNQAVNASKALVENNASALGNLTREDIHQIFGSRLIEVGEFDPKSTTVLEIVSKTGCFETTELASIMIEKGAVLINDLKTENPQQILGIDAVLSNNLTLVRIGTKRAYLIKWL